MLSDLMIDTFNYIKKFNILYVEDDYDNIKMIKYMLNNLFKDVVVAKDGMEGLEVYKKYFNDTSCYFDIIITDIQMPKLNGIDMIKAIYNINTSQKIIVLSAYDNKEYLIPLLNLGVDGFIQKPISLESIFNVLNSMYKSSIDNEIDLKDGYIFKSNRLLKDNIHIELTKNETKLLDTFLKNKDKYLSLEEIHIHIFFDEPLRDFSLNSIRGFIKRLKTKLPTNLIVNNRTLGYKLDL